MAGHSQAPAQCCDTASASKGTAASPPAGHRPTTATLRSAAWHPKLVQALRWSQSMELQPQVPPYPTAPARAIGSPCHCWQLGQEGKAGLGLRMEEAAQNQTEGGRSAVLEETAPANTLPTKPPQRCQLALMGTRNTARWCSSGSSWTFLAPRMETGLKPLHSPTAGAKTRQPAEAPQTQIIHWQRTGTSHPDQCSCETLWTKRPLGKGPLSGFSNLIPYVAHDEGQYCSSVKWKYKNQLVIF